MKAIGYLVLSILIIGLSCLWSGYALSVLWGWFVVGTFGLPQLTINTAIGLAMLVSYMTQPYDNKKTDRSPEEALMHVACTGAVNPAVALGLGWVVRLFA